MDDHYLSLQHDPGNMLGQVGAHSVRPLTRPEMHNLRGPYAPDSLWWQYLAYGYGHVRFKRIWAQAVANCYLSTTQEMPFVISDGTNPRTSWSQSVDGLTARSPILSRGQIPEKPHPLTYAPSNGNGNFGNQTEAVPNCRTHAGYNQVLAGRPPPERGIDLPPPEAQTQSQATCVQAKYHSNTGKNLRKLDKIRIREAHGTLRTAARLLLACISVPSATKRTSDPKTWNGILETNMFSSASVPSVVPVTAALASEELNPANLGIEPELLIAFRGTARPPYPKTPIFLPSLNTLAQITRQIMRPNSRQRIRSSRRRHALVETMFEEFAWQFNLHEETSTSIQSFLANNATLFVNPEHVSQDVRAQLGQKVQLRLYDAFVPCPKELASDLLRHVGPDNRRQNERGSCRGRLDFPTSTSPAVNLNATKNATGIEDFLPSRSRWGTALV
ncbi:hypothetical protein V8E53_015002 [Lactarius tabidus]